MPVICSGCKAERNFLSIPEVCVCVTKVCKALVCKSISYVKALVCKVLVCKVLVCKALVCKVLVCKVLVCKTLLYLHKYVKHKYAMHIYVLHLAQTSNAQKTCAGKRRYMNIKEYYMNNAKSFYFPDMKQKPVTNYGYETATRVYPAQMETQSLGRLQVNCVTQAGFRPIPGATVRIGYTGDPTSVVEELTTDNLGRTEVIDLPAPPLDWSLDPAVFDQPYSEYNVNVTAPGYETVAVSGTQLLAAVTAVQPVEMIPAPETPAGEAFVIPPHTLYGDYPPKIAESEIKPTAETGEIVLREVVVPEFVIVHDGPPTDTSAANYYIRYRDYIKNVASSEIYATWPEATILANILAIMSFTLNRVFTEWYRNQGFNFTITSSTAFDHKWMRGRNIYDNIGLAVDQVFNNYLSRPNVRQPILTQYCDGRNVTCPGWMPLW